MLITAPENLPSARERQRRQFPRYHFGPAVLGAVRLPDKSDRQRAWLFDLSRFGISFQIPFELPAGMMIFVHVKSQHHSETYCLPAQTIYSARDIDGFWRVGCMFTGPLSEDILDDLL